MKPSPYRRSVEEFERRYLLGELERNGWNRTRTARDLGLSYRALLYKIERFQLIAPDKEIAEPIPA